MRICSNNLNKNDSFLFMSFLTPTFAGKSSTSLLLVTAHMEVIML